MKLSVFFAILAVSLSSYAGLRPATRSQVSEVLEDGRSIISFTRSTTVSQDNPSTVLINVGLQISPEGYILNNGRQYRITAHNKTEAGWLSQYLNNTTADVIIIDNAIPNKSATTDISNYQIKINGGDAIGMDDFADQFRDALKDAGYFKLWKPGTDLKALPENEINAVEHVFSKVEGLIGKKSEPAQLPPGSPNIETITSAPCAQ